MKTQHNIKKMTFGLGRARWLSIIVFLLSLALVCVFAGCGGGKKKASSKKKKKDAAKTAAAKMSDTLADVSAAGPAYIYTPVGKRDPFKSFYKVVRGPEKETLGGILTKYEIDQLKLTAVISGISKPRAQVELPSGKGIVVKVGTRIGKNFGRVVRIKNNEVIVAEDYRDWSGRKVTNYIHMKLSRAGKK
ncbi:MAG: pilus assembly protein PilP [Deltaproteobacteria bacterium]|nr:pilus assembly protein PilP [Deltaproteobacteria bacterium]